MKTFVFDVMLNGRFICTLKYKTDKDNYYGWKDTFTEISLCSGSIKKLIGRELSWSDEPVELKEE